MNLEEAEQIAKKLMKKHGLNDWEFKFNRTTTKFGICYLEKNLITISKPLTFLNHKKVVKDIILHEIAHALNWEYYRKSGHDASWKDIAQFVGCRPFAKCSNLNVKTPSLRFIGVCQNCGYFVNNYIRKGTCKTCTREGLTGILEWRELQNGENFIDLLIQAIKFAAEELGFHQ